jgi:hypothetical protein
LATPLKRRSIMLRCKPGDIALVLYDEPGCEANIGRIVQVQGPINTNPQLQLPCWLIQPFEATPWIGGDPGALRSISVTWRDRVEHPDAWMVPLAPLSEEESEAESQSLALPLLEEA